MTRRLAIIAALGAPLALAPVAAGAQTAQVEGTIQRLPAAGNRAFLVFTTAVPRLVTGQQHRFATALVARGSVERANTIRWVSSDPEILAVDANGTVTARRVGRAFITATAGSAATRVRVTVIAPEAPPIASLDVSPANATVDPGTSQQFTATARTGDGSVVSGATFTWTSSDTTVVAITPNGLAVARRRGKAEIRGVSGGAAATVSLTVREPVVTSVSLSPATADLTAGGRQALAIGGTMSDGSALPAGSVSLSARCGTFDGTTYVAGSAACVDTVVASAGGKAASAVISVSLPKVEPEVAPNAVIPVALTLRRYDGGTGAVLVGNGIPLRAGAVQPNEVDQLRVLVGGVEVPSYVEALKGKHRDGSLRSVLVQFSTTVNATQGTATLVKGGSGAPLRRARVAPAAVPVATALPAPEYLLATGIFGRTRTVGEARVTSLGNRYEDLWQQWEPHQWTASGDNWTSNYYDRALVYFAAYARSGNPIYFNRGARFALNYRTTYLEANQYGSSEMWAQLDGLKLHYWFTGDEASRTAVWRTAESLDRSRGTAARLTDTTSDWFDNRNQAKVLGSKVLSIELEAPAYGSISDWQAQVRRDLRWILSTQNSLGAYHFAGQCYKSSNFMTGMLNAELIKYLDVLQVDGDVIIPSLVSSARFLRSQWLPATRTFKYYSGLCVNPRTGVGQGGEESGDDLNGFFIEMWTFLSSQTKDPAYERELGDIMQGLLDKTFFSGNKQFNQAFRTSYLYFGPR
jgi:hypothetical protein